MEITIPVVWPADTDTTCRRCGSKESTVGLTPDGWVCVDFMACYNRRQPNPDGD